MGSPLKSFPVSGTFLTHHYSRLIERRELRMAMDGKITLITPDDFLSEFVRKPPGPGKDASLSTVLQSLPETRELELYDPLVSTPTSTPC